MLLPDAENELLVERGIASTIDDELLCRIAIEAARQSMRSEQYGVKLTHVVSRAIDAAVTAIAQHSVAASPPLPFDDDEPALVSVSRVGTAIALDASARSIPLHPDAADDLGLKLIRHAAQARLLLGTD